MISLVTFLNKLTFKYKLLFLGRYSPSDRSQFSDNSKHFLSKLRGRFQTDRCIASNENWLSPDFPKFFSIFPADLPPQEILEAGYTARKLYSLKFRIQEVW